MHPLLVLRTYLFKFDLGWFFVHVGKASFCSVIYRASSRLSLFPNCHVVYLAVSNDKTYVAEPEPVPRPDLLTVLDWDESVGS